MSKKVSKSPSQLSPLQNSTALASVLQKISQALLDDCTGQCPAPLKGSASTSEQAVPESEEQHQPAQQPEPDQPRSSGSGSSQDHSEGAEPKKKAQAWTFNPVSLIGQDPSKEVRRRHKAIALAFDHRDTTAFADKEVAKYFEEAYAHGVFRSEVRYYYVPWYVVRFEHKWLREHQQNSVLDLLSAVQDELNLRNKLIAYLGKEAESSNLPLAQLSESIFQTLKLLQKIQAHLKSFKLVHKTMLPHRHMLKDDSEV